jgi:hypothetical protein
MIRSLSLKDLPALTLTPGSSLAFDSTSEGTDILAIRIARRVAQSNGLVCRVFRADERDAFEQTRAATLFNRYCFVLIGFKTIPDAGEHIIITTEKNTRAHTSITLSKTLSADEFAALALFLYPDSTKEQLTLLPAIGQMKEGLRADSACLLIDYQRIIGKAAPLFVREWFVRILPAEKRLFALGEALLAGDQRTALARWHAQSPLYSPEFWTVYLSDLFWNAILFSTTAREHGVQAAKELNVRLPFSFMQNGYKKLSLERCARNLTLIAETDSLIKQGGSSTLLDRCVYECAQI